MCQRLQYSEIVFEKKGCVKFSGRRIPSASAAPITISIQPEKSVYSCIVNITAPNQM